MPSPSPRPSTQDPVRQVEGVEGVDPDADPMDHADRAVLVPSGPGSLADQGSLVDEDGDDIREYTGEPVETDEGWVVPQAQNTGAGRGLRADER